MEIGNMVLFKRPLIMLILQGRKTQTRRIHKRELHVGHVYPITWRWFTKPEGHILITRKFRQKLGEISEQDVRKEGFDKREDFKAAWVKINGEWTPDKVVIVYEFKVVT